MTKLSNFVTISWTTKKGIKKHAYYYRQSRQQGRKRIPLGTDYAEALKKYADIIGADIAQPAPETVAAVVKNYFTWAHNRKVSNLSIRTIADREGYWKNQLEETFGNCNINDLMPEWMLEYFETRSSQVSAKKELKFLSVLCNWARARGHMQSGNPCTGIMQQLKVDETREIYVEDTWYNLTHKKGSQLVKDAMDFTYRFANRPAETANAMFKHIEGDELVIELQKTKGKGLKEKRVPLTGDRLAFINQQKAKTPRSFYIVSDESGQRLRVNGRKFRREWKAARDAAAAQAAEKGINYTRFQLRDIRAKAATDIARDHSIEAARLMLGHTTQKQTAAYIRSVKGAARIALKKEA